MMRPIAARRQPRALRSRVAHKLQREIRDVMTTHEIEAKSLRADALRAT
jgi:hypothetical protein